MKVAVVTDAVSSSFIFPVWYKYYASNFGGENIFVATYAGKVKQFQSYELGFVKSIAENYNDDVRKIYIAELVTSLLDVYDVVIRVDSDEFLIPENAGFNSLKEFIDQWEGQYITARGFDIFEHVDDTSLNIQRPILEQREYCYPLNAMNKTSVTRTPLKWGRGFHYCNAKPNFDGLILLHTKRLSIDMQNDWNNFMIENSKNDEFVKNYYGIEKDKVKDYHKWRSECCLNQEDFGKDSIFQKNFFKNVSYNFVTDLHEGKYEMSSSVCKLPREYRKYF